MASHRRLNVLTGEWVLCSPHRAKRPWLGQVEDVSNETGSEYLPDCYLCPGNKRATNGAVNPNYRATFVFDNDFPAVLPENEVDPETRKSPFFQSVNVSGTCKVVCFSPKHNLSMPLFSIAEIETVIDAWRAEFDVLSSQPGIEYVQIFENKGAVMGCSNPHPHGQIWATSHIPMEPGKELVQFTKYKQQHQGNCLLCDYISEELKASQRIIFQNDSFLVLVPFWALWPFETLLVPKKHLSSILDITTPKIKQDFAEALSILTIKYDNLFSCSFPYSMGIHQFRREKNPEFHFHLHFYPPLLRSASVKKFLVGYEMLAEPQRDLTAEQAAERLVALDSVHYSKKHK